MSRHACKGGSRWWRGVLAQLQGTALPPTAQPGRGPPAPQRHALTAHAAGLAAVRDGEVVVAVVLHLLVPGGVVAVAHGLRSGQGVAGEGR